MDHGRVWSIQTPSHAPVGFVSHPWGFWDLCPIFPTIPWGLETLCIPPSTIPCLSHCWQLPGSTTPINPIPSDAGCTGNAVDRREATPAHRDWPGFTPKAPGWRGGSSGGALLHPKAAAPVSSPSLAPRAGFGKLFLELGSIPTCSSPKIPWAAHSGTLTVPSCSLPWFIPRILFCQENPPHSHPISHPTSHPVSPCPPAAGVAFSHLFWGGRT